MVRARIHGTGIGKGSLSNFAEDLFSRVNGQLGEKLVAALHHTLWCSLQEPLDLDVRYPLRDRLFVIHINRVWRRRKR
jgi:hypothetical protein